MFGAHDRFFRRCRHGAIGDTIKAGGLDSDGKNEILYGLESGGLKSMRFARQEI
ncbi:MAG: hypothetical protein HOI98_07110 [Rhodospirillaceae bacterium]|nr:hypothetical protein [Rhodospirillaceae bacterium]